MDLPVRKHPRLKDYDYSSNGAYFVTICTKDKAMLLGSIVGRGAFTPPQTCLSDAGSIAERCLQNIANVYPGVCLKKHVIMPNHIHMIVSIEGMGNGGGMRASRPTLHTIVRSFKTMVTCELGCSIWQASYYEHIVRNEEDYLAIWKYIDENPAKWANDELYMPE